MIENVDFDISRYEIGIEILRNIDPLIGEISRHKLNHE